jgi:predicted glycoside hydrolase/deacetylase ChbG (UPF0249 family)
MPATVFVNIDDAGSSSEVNEALLRCARAGAADGASILATGSEAADACSICMEYGIAVSAHLNCVEPPFLTGGTFPRPAFLALRARRLLGRLEAEWRAQIEKLLSLGALVTGLDSHRHIHHLPGIAEMTIALAAEYRAGVVRAAVLPDRFSRPSGPILDSLGRRTAALAAAAGIRTRVAMAGFGASGRVTREYLERLGLPDGECELVMHPATRPLWSAGQPAELELMLSEWFGTWKRSLPA